jgi:hypothetical protein
MAFQERYCLTERHVRCEMFKFAQSAREAALGSQDGSPAAQVSSARFRPSVRSVPVAVGPSRTSAGSGSRGRRPNGIVVVAIGAGILLVLVLLALALSGGGGGGTPGPGASQTAPPASVAPATAVPPTEAPIDAASIAPEGTGPPSSEPAADAVIFIEYEVQEGEALVRIAETFGTTRAKILDANEGMRDRDPYTEAGDVIIVPVSSTIARDVIEAQQGFVGYVE